MKALIIEDERPIALRLTSIIKTLRPDIEIVAVTETIESTAEVIKQNRDIDIIFADIMLKDGYSFDALDAVNPEAYIIFVTGYDEFALKAFDYNCIDYLLKPVSPGDIEKAFKRLETNLSRANAKETIKVKEDLSSNINLYRRKLELSSGADRRIVRAEDVCALDYNSGIITVYVNDGQKGCVFMSLSSLMDGLDPNKFVRVNRNQIVNVSAVDKIRSTLSRKKMVILKHPYEDISIETNTAVAKLLKAKMLQY